MNITLDEERIAEVKEKLEQISMDFETSYEMLTELIRDIETSGAWKGEGQKAFLAYMDLVQQYHKCFTDKYDENPMASVVKLFSELMNHCSSFYGDFVEYRYLGEIE